MLTPADYLKHSRSYFEEIVQRVYERYQKLLTESSALDFDDLLLKTVQLFREKPEVLARYQDRYLHLQVDEFQDTNLVQYELMKLLAGKHRNICVVGDPDQSIYSWRAADLRNILNFEKDYPDARVVFLEQNYRSTKLILEVASHVISANRQRKEKKLWTENEAGLPAAVIETYNEQEEAQFVVSEIDRLTSQEGMKLGDFAVMYRTNAQSRALEEAFIRYGTPYRLVAGTRFYERREVKDVLAYLRLIQNPSDTVSLMRIINVPQRGIGQRSLDELAQWARTQGIPEYRALQLLSGPEEKASPPPISPRTVKSLAGFAAMMEGFIARRRELKLVELFDLVTEATGYKPYLAGMVDGDERWENVLELRTVADEYRDLKPSEALSAFLEGVALVSDVDGMESGANAVTLITLHQAKGLEFPVVFIVGMEEGLLPHFKSIDDAEQLEEERRLCYVGITRAQKRVYLVRAFRRSLMGSSAPRSPSRFLKDIPPRLLAGGTPRAEEEGGVEPETESLDETAKPRYHITTARSTAPEPRYDLPRFKAGDHVRHAQFGEGIVVSCHMMKNDAEVVVAFDGAGVKRLLLSFAKIEKV
jgi:DNA helicase-2/ATP-dependent DNA helicase PcrA